MAIQITTELLGDHPKLNDISINGHELSTSWLRDGDGLIGFGEWRTTSVFGPNLPSAVRLKKVD